MPAVKQRGSRVVYVAGSVRELPGYVQDWLGESGNRASSCPDIYDLLALLATGRKPVAALISIDAVDWDELEFFDLIRQMSPDTQVYVAGEDHQEAKIDAACLRGAQVFDADALSEAARPVQPWSRFTGPAGLLAGSLRPVETNAGPAPQAPAAPAATPIEASPESEEAPERPAVRLVMSTDEPVAEEESSSVPFPWAPSPNRPKRTPPRRGAEDDAVDEATRVENDEEHPAPPACRPPMTAPIHLTPEELAALLGRPADPPGGRSAQE